MSDYECGESRAEGAFSNFLIAMHKEMGDKNRSEEYSSAFWIALEGQMINYLNSED